MQECGSYATQWIKERVARHFPRTPVNGWALEVACGDAPLAQAFLKDYFADVHVFDRDAEALRRGRKAVGPKVKIELSDMVHFEFIRDYHAVFFRWSLGYIKEHQVGRLLKEAVSHLATGGCILILDNLADQRSVKKGQTIRSRSNWDKIFEELTAAAAALNPAKTLVVKSAEREFHRELELVGLW